MTFGNGSFVVEGHSEALCPRCDVSNKLALVQVQTFATNVADWADRCTTAGCTGLILYVAGPGSQLQTTMQLTAWSYWMPQAAPAFAALPIVVCTDDVGAIGAADVVRISSSAPGRENPMGTALAGPATTYLYAALAVACVTNVLFAIVKFFVCIVGESGEWRSAPATSLVTLAGFAAGQAISAIKCANVAWGRNQALPFSSFLFCLFSDSALLATGRFSIGVAVRRAQPQPAAGSTDERARLRKATGRAATLASALLIALMYAATIASAFTQEIPAGAIATWLFFMAANVLFNARASRDVTAVVKTLLLGRAQLGLSAQEAQQRIAFSKRIGVSLLTVYLVMISQLVVVCVQNQSPTHFLMAYAGQMAASALQSTTAIILLRSKPSRVTSLAASAMRRRVAAAPSVPKTGASPVLVSATPQRKPK